MYWNDLSRQTSSEPAAPLKGLGLIAPSISAKFESSFKQWRALSGPWRGTFMALVRSRQLKAVNRLIDLLAGCSKLDNSPFLRLFLGN